MRLLKILSPNGYIPSKFFSKQLEGIEITLRQKCVDYKFKKNCSPGWNNIDNGKNSTYGIHIYNYKY